MKGFKEMSQRKTLNYYLMKINRLIVWILLPLMIVFFVTGYGLTKPNTIHSLTGGVLNYKTALYPAHAAGCAAVLSPSDTRYN